MRITLFVIAFLLCHFVAFNQSAYLEKFIDKYSDQEDTNSLNLNDWSLQLTSSFTNKESGKRIKNKITRFRLLSSDRSSLVSQNDFRSLIKNLHKEDFEDLVEVRDKGNNVKFMIRENKTHITDVLMLVQGKDGFVLLSLEGLFNLDDLENLNIEVEEGKHFKRLAEHNRA